jgi:uncharacterized protein (DUF2147 family)
MRCGVVENLVSVHIAKKMRDTGMKTVKILGILGLLLAPLGAAASSDPVHGLWLTENGNAIVEFAPCGAETCGRMVWVANPRDSAGLLKRDFRNEDADKRERTLCGLPLLGGLDLAKRGAWSGGWIYNPRDGSTYGAEVEVVSQDELKVRGYLGVSLLGSSQTWTRVTDDRGGC